MSSIDLSSLNGVKISSDALSRRFCISFPPLVNSNGIWQYFKGSVHYPLEASLPRFEFHVIAVFTFTQACHFLLKRLGIPIFVSQIIAGLILHQAVLALDQDYRHVIVSQRSLGFLETAAAFGYMMFVFLMGVKMDVRIIHRTGKKTLFTALLSLVTPLIFGSVALLNVSKIWRLDNYKKLQLLEVILTHSLSPFPVISSLINDLHIINSELGRLGLSCALVSDIVGAVIARSGFWITRVLGKSAQRALIELGSMAGFMLFVAVVVKPAMLWIIKQTPEGKPVKSLYIQYIIMLAVASSFLSHQFGQYFFFGPFILGLAVPAGPPLGSALVDKLDPIVSGLLIPLLVTTCALRVNLQDMIHFSDEFMMSTAVVVAAITLGKFAGALIPPLFCKVPKRDAIALALIISCKGIVELTAYTNARYDEAISAELFHFLLVTILLTATAVPILVKLLYDPSRKYGGYQKRNIMQSKAKELRILTCIYRPDNIPAILNFLDATCTNRGSPVAVYVLHLINISGRAAPLFISHQMQTKTVSNRSYSENVILSFRCFEEKNKEAVCVHFFTAISPPKFMHEDICTLALDELTSIVVLPFHRKWFLDGCIESDDNTRRALNCCVLERAPCSVAILVDRGHLGGFNISKDLSSGSSFSFAMLFFGGSDDREALTLAKRMSQKAIISLTVIRFIAKNDDKCTDWEKVLDSEVLRDVKPDNNFSQRVTYVEEMVEDGENTLSEIQSIAGKYDCIIVGRRNNIETPQISGVDKASEFPELGIVGNFLVTKDLPRRYSVLVVQQQITVQ